MIEFTELEIKVIKLALTHNKKILSDEQYGTITQKVEEERRKSPEKTRLNLDRESLNIIEYCVNQERRIDVPEYIKICKETESKIQKLGRHRQREERNSRDTSEVEEEIHR